jgi:hypothetical protein
VLGDVKLECLDAYAASVAAPISCSLRRASDTRREHGSQRRRGPVDDLDATTDAPLEPRRQARVACDRHLDEILEAITGVSTELANARPRRALSQLLEQCLAIIAHDADM